MSDRLGLFDAFGIECEYMLVDESTLDIRPVVDDVLSDWTGVDQSSDCQWGEVTWSNELVRHVIELKTTDPMESFIDTVQFLEEAIEDAQEVMESRGLLMLPTAMHPWMNPVTETQLWPHENREIYETYDRIFNCHDHGWANLQSTHLNLPFANDEEFGKLHAAIRLLLPILPAIAASSPVYDGQMGPWSDNRLAVLMNHCHAIPSLMGEMIPEPIFDEASYRKQIFDRLFDDVRMHDPEGNLRGEFLNARGAIARFDRGSIEIRVIDVQECPAADVAICAATVAVLRLLVSEQLSNGSDQRAMQTARLKKTFLDVAQHGETAVIDDAEYLRALGRPAQPISAVELWSELLDQSSFLSDDVVADPLRVIFSEGTLSTRIRRSLDGDVSRARLVDVYSDLADCLANGMMYQP